MKTTATVAGATALATPTPSTTTFTRSCRRLSTLTADTERGTTIRGCLADLERARTELDISTAWDHLVEAITAR